MHLSTLIAFFSLSLMGASTKESMVTTGDAGLHSATQKTVCPRVSECTASVFRLF